MDDGSRLPLISAVLLLFVAVFFAVAETAFASTTRARMRVAEERGDMRAKEALYVLDNFDLAISAILIGTNIVHISVAALVTLAVTRRWGLGAVSVSTLITTGVVFYFGEMLPKSIAKKYSDKLALATASLLVFFMKLFRPASRLLTAIGQAAARLTPGDAEKSVTEDELYDIIEDMTEEGSLDEEQGDLISSALQFGDVTVENVLTPRVDLVALDMHSSHAQILDCIKACTHSRLPVYEGSIDNIVGILQIRKYIKAYLREGENLDIQPLLDDVFFVHQSTKIDELLPVMSKRKHNLAVVTDNYGGTLGIVTVEDIVEELVGEIWDEEDVVEEPIVEISEGVFEVDADESVSDVFERLGYEDPEEDEELINTLMGEWAYEQFTAIPQPGDSFTYHRVSVTVIGMEHNRILKLRVTLLPENEGGETA
ncbi:MAG: HlyC/CorC family transporter [Oscillospiraceae bacterium]|nr:HlyC/CorC family transporter [Oscillospiraceae bacterium]